MRAFTRIVAAVAVFVPLSCGGNGGSSAPSSSTPSAPSAPAIPVSAVAPDLANLITQLTMKWFEATGDWRGGYPAPADTSWNLSCPQGGSMQVANFGSNLDTMNISKIANWIETYSNCAWTSQGQTITANGQLTINGNYAARLISAFIPWMMQVQGNLTVSASVGSVNVSGTLSSTTPFTGTIGGTSATVSVLPSVAPWATATPSSLRISCGVPDLVVPLGTYTGCSAPAVYSDGAVRSDSGIAWATSDSSVLSIQPSSNGNGVTITPRKNGGATLSAAYQSLRASLGIGAGSGSPPSPAPSPSPTPTPTPTPTPSPSGSCTFQAGCILNVIYSGSTTTANTYDFYFSDSASNPLKCKHPTPLCFGLGCPGESGRILSRQFFSVPKLSPGTVTITRTGSTSVVATRSIDLYACKPDLTFP